MRVKRVGKFRRLRRQNFRRAIVLYLILPFASIFMGYLITSLVILPSISK
ncbi:MAG: hypothetical protein N2489_02305 [Clostridia bacterium]|nr:hypothetical protein [Clostridia bacterium]